MEVENIEHKDLTLDRHNPRFGLSEAVDEEDALRILAETGDLEELWNSISERGFESFEPIVATKQNGKLIVLEGNRRLAAVKLLHNPDLFAKKALRKKIPILHPEKLNTCEKLPTIVVSDRTKAADHIGFKHVNGPARWSSLAKARFGVIFYERLSNYQTPQKRMQSLTKRLGDSRGLILRLLVAYKIVQQCINLGYFDKLNVNEKSIEFSHLYTLISNPDSRKFIGLPNAPLSEDLIRDNPIPRSHIDELYEVLKWLFGENSVIRSQGADRPRLQRVLANPKAIEELRLTGSLDSAETVAGLKSEEWLKQLANISKTIQKASKDVSIVGSEFSDIERKHTNNLLTRIKNQLKQIEVVVPEL